MFPPRKTIAMGLFLFSASVLMFVADAAGQVKGGMGMPPGAPRPGGGGANETYCIVEVGHDMQVIATSGMKTLKKQLDDEYKAAQKAYDLAKKDKANKGVTLEKPEKRTVKQVPGKTGYKSMDKAQEELQKILADRDKGGDKKSKR
jgi:hypothetical protein